MRQETGAGQQRRTSGYLVAQLAAVARVTANVIVVLVVVDLYKGR